MLLINNQAPVKRCQDCTNVWCYHMLLSSHTVLSYRWTWNIQVCYKTAGQETTSLWTNNSNLFRHRFFVFL